MTTSTATRTPATSTGFRRAALTGYRWLLLAFLLLGVAQIFLAGLGAFGLDDPQPGHGGETAFDPHRTVGFIMGGAAGLILVAALIARPRVRSVIASAVLFLLAFLGQSLLADLGHGSALFGGLHALDGFLILAIAGMLYVWSRRQ